MSIDERGQLQRHVSAALFSACGGGDLDFLSRWAARDADGFAECLRTDGNGAVALVAAVQRNRPECVQFLLQHVDANAAAPSGQRPVIEAAQRGHTRVMRILLDHGADPDLATPTNKNTALVLASAHGHREAVRLLLERGARVNLQVSGSPTALSSAATCGHLEVMRDLFAAGGDLSLVNRLGGSPLFMATAARQPEAAELLLAWGADVTLRTFDRAETALMMAAREGYAHLATRFLAKAAEADAEGGGEAFLNARTSFGETALMVACGKGAVSVVGALLQHPRIDVDAQDHQHVTALVKAVNADQAGIAEALLARGASVQPDARAVSSALKEACALGMPADLVRRILERGGAEAGVNFRGGKGVTPLMWACYRNELEVAEMLLRAGADVDAVDDKGWTPLMFAAGFENGAEMTRLLLGRGADPNVHGAETSPLVLACGLPVPESGGEVVQALIRAGADVNAQNSDGATPLQVAIDKSNKDAVDALLKSGAGVQADNAQRQLVDYIYELKRDLRAVPRESPGRKRTRYG